MNTRSRIVLLVVLAALPALLFTVYSSWDERVRTELHARHDLTRLVTLASQRQAQVIEGARQTLVAISLVPASALDDRARCGEFLAKLRERSAGLYHSMGILDADGVLLCNAVPWQGTIASPDRLYVRLARSTGQFAIGEYQVGRVTREQGINFGYPVMGPAGNVIAIAFVAIDLKSLSRMAASTPLPPEAILAVLDRDGVALARHPELAERIGQKVSNPNVLKTVLAGRNGVFRERGRDGDERLFAFDSVAENADGSVAVRVMVSMPMNVIFAEANQAFLRDLVGIVAATLLVLIAAWYGTELFVLRKLRILLDAAARIHSGDLGARTGLRREGEELSQLGHAFDGMAAALQQRDAELKRTIEDARTQAVTDALTGLPNRRYLQDYLPHEWARAKRNGSTLAVIMLDIDRFKRINDDFGHEAGDLVLKEIGSLLGRGTRATDLACRFGGEEFMLVLPDASLDGARQKAEKIRESFKRLSLRYRDQPLGTITASFGVALFPLSAGDPESLIHAADEALYEAKRAGRDRVVICSTTAAQLPAR